MALFAWRRQPLTAAGSGEASPQRARGAVRGGRGALRVEKTSPTAARGAFLRGNVRRAGRQRALSAAVERSLGEKTPPQQRGGVFVRQCSPGRTAKGAVRSGRALSGRKNTSVARGGVFARQCSRSRAAKGAVCGGRGVLRAERHLRSSAGAFLCGNVRRAGRQRALSAAVGALSEQKKRPPQRAGTPFTARLALWRSEKARRARPHLRRGACSAPSAAISSPAPTRGAEGFSASRASMHRPPKTQTANRRKTNQRWM